MCLCGEENDRRFEKQVGENWLPVNFPDLRENDTFRVFESDGTPVEDTRGEKVFKAACNPRKRFDADNQEYYYVRVY